VKTAQHNFCFNTCQIGMHVAGCVCVCRVNPWSVETCVPALGFGRIERLQGPKSSTGFIIPIKSSIHVLEGARCLELWMDVKQKLGYFSENVDLHSLPHLDLLTMDSWT